MSRFTVALAILGIGLALLLLNQGNDRILGVANDDFGRLVYLAPLAVLIGAGIWAGRRAVGESLRHLLIWLVIILALATAYVYRREASDVGNRLLAGLIPGHAFVVTSEGGDEVILHKLMSGHFEADVSVNGQTIRMLVDTGASMLTLSREDAARVGLIPENLNYSMTVMTANGRARAAPVELREVAIGPIVRRNVNAMVAEDGKLDQSLLGMSFLETLGSMQMQTDELRLRD